MNASMFSFAAYITPEQAYEMNKENQPDMTLEKWREYSKNNETCCNCDQPVWRLAGLDMCFSCTTGETDASNDYELIINE